jgi:hypothetical protein
VGFGGKIFDLNLEMGDVKGTGHFVGGLAGINIDGSITTTYSSGSVYGTNHVGGLVGGNGGNVMHCHSTGVASGNKIVGGLVGSNIGPVGTVTDCYSTGVVDGDKNVGGLVGTNGAYITRCYSMGAVRAIGNTVGGLLGGEGPSIVTVCFWDVQTSGQNTSIAGTGKTTAEMQKASTFLEAGWDFVDETVNGTDDIWWILEGQDYPRLWREFIPEN